MISLLIIMMLAANNVDPLTHVGALTEQLRSPARIALTADDTVLVTDPFYDHIARFDSAGNLLGTWSVPEGPLGVAAHPDGRFFVSLRDEAQVGIYVDDGGTFIRTGYLDGDGSPLVTFVRPTDIDIDTGTGRIYVVDAEGDEVYGFESDGTLALKFGIRGEGNGEFMYPSAIAVDEANGRLIVGDHDNFRGQIFSTAGVFLERFGYRMKYLPGGEQEGWLPRTQGLAVDGAGRIYVADALMCTVRIFDPDGTELGKVVEYGFDPGALRIPCDLALNSDGSRLYVASTNSSRVEIYETPDWRGGRGGWPKGAAGGFDPPGTNWCPYDAPGTSVGRWGLEHVGGGEPHSGRSGYDGPHMIDATIICGRCHGITGQPGGHVGLLEGQGVLCMSCHSAGGQALSLPIHERDVADPYGTNPDAVDARGISHAWGVSAVSALADSVGPAAGGEMERYLDEDGKLKCATCHDQHSSDAGWPYLRVSNAGDAMCKECHAPRDEGPGERGTHAVGFDYPGGEGEFPADGEVAPLYLKDEKVECSTCHAPHYADSGGANGGEGDGMLLRAANDETLCQICHTEHSGHSPSGSWQPACKECHDLHDPDNENLSLVAALVHNETLGEDKPVVFTARSGAHSFDDGDPAENDGICQVCHTATSYHTHDGSGTPHHDGETCTDCHPHDAGFMPAGGSCVECHSQPQDNGDGVPPGGRRAVVGEFALASHHLQGESVEGADCVVCHDMSEHQQGYVRLKNADDPEAVTVLEGDPALDPAEAARLEVFCLVCHDADGAGGSVPFSDGITPPPIDAAAWADASHQLGGAAGPMTCFGDGETFGCHSTGHGSAKRMLLAPADASQPPVPGDPLREEEGMCYTCHDADGPASSDLESEFALAHHHNVSSLDQGDGSRVECSDCHNPHSANSAALLADPDSGGVWTGGGADFCLTCHDGVPPAQVSFPGDAAGTGYDKSAYPGTTHAANLGPNSCRYCHEEHGSAYLSLLKDQYVVADHNPYSPGDGDYAACWICHDETATIEEENAFADRHQRHVKNAKAPCFICHDTHAPFDAGEEGLVNFEPAVQLEYDIEYIDGHDGSTSFWIDADGSTGYCYIRCHSKPHKPKDYERVDASTVDCALCHDRAQDDGDGIPPGGRRAVVPDGTDPHDFGNTSHHVQGEVDSGDCLVCHDMSQHQQGYVRLKDPDDPDNPGAVIELVNRPMDDPAEAAALDPFCLNCHDDDGDAPFSDGLVAPFVDPGLWDNAGHKLGWAAGVPLTCMGDGATFGCHANGHGSPNVKLLNADEGVSLDSFCFTCHTDGMIVNEALAGEVDDLEEAFAFAERHNLGTSFTVGENTYTLQCTSCHNPHIVTGKHWDVTSGVTPVTRPDLMADPISNPRAMGSALWGALPGEKMDDFAALAAGTGGWYYSVARGGSLVWDQPAVYQPPKTEGGGWENHEFAGDVLPDYASLCLDCHTYRMSAANPPVNWGQGIDCTDSSVDPPDQRIECGAQHGLAPANKPYAWDPESTFYGSSGNPDPIFHEDFVQRGRGAGQFMRWPYDSVHRNAGINFVMSCTDCHEAHGSPVGSMLRTTVNDGPGSTIWNSMCNNCHYYYGYQHEGMSCASASCHEANSIHRIIHVTHSGDTFLWTEPSRPDYTPEIASVEGALDSNELVVTFTQGVWTNMDQTGALEPGDFLLTDVGDDNPRTITAVTHTPGEAVAVITTSAPQALDDFGVDTLATSGISVWDVEGDPAGPWPVTLSGFDLLVVVHGVDGHEKLAVWFSERAYANPDATGALEPSDFEFTDAGAGKSVIAVDHAPGAVTATLTLDGPIAGADIGSATLAAAAHSIYDITGYPSHTTDVILAEGAASSIEKVEGVEGSDKLKVTFRTQVYANDDETGGLDANDFIFTDGSGGGATAIIADGVAHVAGRSTALVTVNAALIDTDIGSDTLAAASESIFGPSAGGFPLGTAAVTISAQTAPAITRVEGAVGYDQLFISFSEGVYAESDGTGGLEPADFAFTDGSGGGAASIIGVAHTAGSSTAIVTVDTPLAAGDIAADALAAVSDEIFNSIANPVGTTPASMTANDCPAWGTTFPIEDEPQYSPTIEDETGLLTGTVGNPTFVFPDADNDWFNGVEDEVVEDTFVDCADSQSCLNSPRAVTIEARVKPTAVDRGVGDNTFNRVFERRRTILLTILNTDYRGDDVPARAGKASIEVKYRVDTASRHTCPHPQWPADPYVGADSKMHQMSSDIDLFPIVDNHWYQIKVVFNSDKSDIAGSNGTPVDIFIDDQGEGGLNNPNPTPWQPGLNPDYEQWPGYVNATMSINECSSCKWGALPGDFLEFREDSAHIGASWNHNQPFEGQIDWVTWQPIADYAGVDDPPH